MALVELVNTSGRYLRINSLGLTLPPAPDSQGKWAVVDSKDAKDPDIEELKGMGLLDVKKVSTRKPKAKKDPGEKKDADSTKTEKQTAKKTEADDKKEDDSEEAPLPNNETDSEAMRNAMGNKAVVMDGGTPQERNMTQDATAKETIFVDPDPNIDEDLGEYDEAFLEFDEDPLTDSPLIEDSDTPPAKEPVADETQGEPAVEKEEKPEATFSDPDDASTLF